MLALTVLTTIFLTGLSVFAFFKWKFSYWKRNNLHFLQPKFPFGNIPNPFTIKQKPGLLFTSMYNEMKKKGWKHGGIYVFTIPVYLVVDLDYAKAILAKDFDYFNEHGFYYNERDDPLSAHLFHVGGNQWKTLRSKLNPTFTSSKIKMLFPIIQNCANNLLHKIETMHEEGATLDTYKTMSFFTIDNLGSCAFGLDCKLLEDENSEFWKSIMKCVEVSRLKLLILFMSTFFSKVANSLRIRAHPKYAEDFFINLVTNIVELRTANKCNTRQDFMQLLIDLRHNSGETLSIEEMAAQCLVFFVAGFETSAVIMTFVLYELSKHQDIQDRVRQEINEVLARHQNETGYEAIMELNYLNQVIDETMRHHPTGFYIPRKCSRNYRVPYTNVVIEKGTLVLIPLHGIYNDEEHYPEPEKFDPERFNETNKKTRHNYAHLPFGEGPRVCIGKRFALLVMKMGIVTILKNFKFTLNERTEEPVRISMNSFVVKPESKIWLNVHKV